MTSLQSVLPILAATKKMYDKRDSDGTFRLGQQKIMFFLLVTVKIIFLVAFVILVYSFSVYRTQGNWPGILQLALHTSV